MKSPVLFVAATLIIAANAAKIPSDWKTCPRNVPQKEHNACIKDAVTKALIGVFANGVPSLKIPPLEPFKIPQLKIGQGNGPVAVDVILTDVVIANVDSNELKETRFNDLEHYTFGADVTWKEPLVITSKYELNGKVLVLPITGKGDCRLQLDNVKATIIFSGAPRTKGGQTYMNVTDCIFEFETDKLHLHFENLFDGNKQLGDNMNAFLNENWEPILKELKPAISEAMSQVSMGVTRQTFNKVPYNQIFPPS